MNPQAKRETGSLPFISMIRNFQPLWVYFVQNRWALAVGLLSLLFVDALQLVIPLVIKQAIDILVSQTERAAYLLLRQAGLILGIALVIALFRYVWRRLIFGHSRIVEQRLRDRMYAHLQTLSLSFFRRTPTGDLMARAINDINAVRMASGMGLVALIDGSVLGAAAIGFMVSIDPRLTLISLIPAPFVVLLSRSLTRRMSKGFETVQRTFSDLTERIREVFAGIRVIKAHHRESWEYQRIKEEGSRYVTENMGLARTLALFFPVMSLFTNVGLVVVILLGGRYAILGEITPGDFVAFISYLNLMTWPMMAMGWVTNLLQRASASMRRINAILNESPEIRDPDPGEGISTRSLLTEDFFPGPRAGAIDIRGLSFTYPHQDRFALRDIRVSIAPSENVAVVGRVGSGKTTLLQAIPRLLDVPKQTVFVADRDICTVSLKSLREGIGVVPQEVFIFSDTIRSNVVFGREGISDAEVEEALYVAGILEEVQGLEKGIDTLLGERGITLSGGQRQRLTIARAMVRSYPVLILDDALSMVDTRTEELILHRILDRRPDKTNLIVSHRVSTIQRADRILVLDHGEVVAEGAHDRLIGQGGIYAALYEEQLRQKELEEEV